MNCPACKTVLALTDRQGVEIDYCPQCRGVWLDRGELDRILDRERRASAGVRDDDEDFFEEMEGRRSPRGGDRGGDRDRDREYEASPKEAKKRRRRGMLEDLFDFDF